MLIAVDNAASRRVAEKLGATREGILRHRLVLGAVRTDAALYALIAEPE
jgi:RimJ/RimL family protein N-acetyltransferase